MSKQHHQVNGKGAASNRPPICASCHSKPGTLLLVVEDTSPKGKALGWYLCPECLIKLADDLKASWEEPGPLCEGCPYRANCPDAGKLASEREKRACPD